MAGTRPVRMTNICACTGESGHSACPLSDTAIPVAERARAEAMHMFHHRRSRLFVPRVRSLLQHEWSGRFALYVAVDYSPGSWASIAALPGNRSHIKLDSGAGKISHPPFVLSPLFSFIPFTNSPLNAIIMKFFAVLPFILGAVFQVAAQTDATKAAELVADLKKAPTQVARLQILSNNRDVSSRPPSVP